MKSAPVPNLSRIKPTPQLLFAFCLRVQGICENTVWDFHKTVLPKIIIFVPHLQQSHNASSKDHQPTATEE
jgi:hypothetical protein